MSGSLMMQVDLSSTYNVTFVAKVIVLLIFLYSPVSHPHFSVNGWSSNKYSLGNL